MRLTELIECLKVALQSAGDIDVYVGVLVVSDDPQLDCHPIGAIMHDVEHGNMVIASQGAIAAAHEEHHNKGKKLGQILVMTKRDRTP